MSKHTPVTWRAIISADCQAHSIYGDKHRIADVINYDYSPHEDRPRDEANARLIAAAPEMLEALNRCETELSKIVHLYRYFGESPDLVLRLARKAIYKAEGKANGRKENTG